MNESQTLGAENVIERSKTSLPGYRGFPSLSPTTVVLSLLAVCGSVEAVGQTLVKTDYVVMSWLPAQTVLHLKPSGAAQSAAQAVAPRQALASEAVLCLAPGVKVPQTLVQVQPKEGGEARFVVLGGRKPVCAEVGAAWRSASTSEGPWYQSLFSVLRSDRTAVRISASTAGATRDPSEGETLDQQVDRCGIYPTKSGVVLLSAGSYRLTLGTSLPDGHVLRWTTPGQGAGTSVEVSVVGGRVEMPERRFKVGEQLHLSAPDAIGSGPGKDCHVSVSVLPQQASPLEAVRARSSLSGASKDLAHATLVANLLLDESQAGWHAWLLTTLQRSQRQQEHVFAQQLWAEWWAHESVAKRSESQSAK